MHNREYLEYMNHAGMTVEDENVVVLASHPKARATVPVPKEVFWYEYFLEKLLEWAAKGYPPERLARDLRFAGL